MAHTTLSLLTSVFWLIVKTIESINVGINLAKQKLCDDKTMNGKSGVILILKYKLFGQFMSRDKLTGALLQAVQQSNWVQQQQSNSLNSHRCINQHNDKVKTTKMLRSEMRILDFGCCSNCTHKMYLVLNSTLSDHQKSVSNASSLSRLKKV